MELAIGENPEKCWGGDRKPLTGYGEGRSPKSSERTAKEEERRGERGIGHQNRKQNQREKNNICSWYVRLGGLVRVGPGTGLGGCRESHPADKRSRAKGAFVIGWLMRVSITLYLCPCKD